MRALVYFQGPIAWGGVTYNSVFDRESEQDDIFIEWAEDMRKDLETGESDTFEVRYLNQATLDERFFTVFAEDFNYIAVSLFLVFCYMWFTLKSFWLTLNSMLHIVFSFPITLVIFRGMF